MEIKRGIPVSPGVAIGPALVLDTEWFRIPQRFIEPDQCEAEVERLRQALSLAARETRESQQAVTARASSGPKAPRRRQVASTRWNCSTAHACSARTRASRSGERGKLSTWTGGTTRAA